MSFTIEEDRGTYERTSHRHDGYYAGDFSQVPMASPQQLAALIRLCPAGSTTHHPS